MPHSYVTVTVLKGTGVLNVDGTAYDVRLRQLLEHVSVQIDRYVGRQIQPFDATLYYDGDDTTLMPVRDLISVTSLKEDTNKDGTFETTWDAKDYEPLPYNAQPTEDWGKPYSMLQVSNKSDGTQDTFLRGSKMYQLIGTHGYIAVTRDSGVKTSGSLGSTATSMTVDSTGTLEPGMTLLVDSERMYIEAFSGTNVTVQRKTQGSTGATHGTAVAISYYLYPGPVQEAVIIQSARLWRRRDSGFASQIGLPETGQMMMWTGGLDTDVKQSLAGYRRFSL